MGLAPWNFISCWGTPKTSLFTTLMKKGHWLRSDNASSSSSVSVSLSSFIINMQSYPYIFLIRQILNYVLFQIDMEKLAGFLPLHLIAVLMTSDKDEALFRYLLSGIRLLHSLCDLAPRHAKLEQVPILILA